jgi:hypothetical protein
MPATKTRKPAAKAKPASKATATATRVKPAATYDAVMAALPTDKPGITAMAIASSIGSRRKAVVKHLDAAVANGVAVATAAGTRTLHRRK